MTAPHSKCNFLTDDRRLIIGSMPSNIILGVLLKFGVTVFVNLVPGFSYKSSLSPRIKYIHLPIGQGSVPSDDNAEKLVDTIIGEYNSGKTVYIHCVGGNGRAGTIAGLTIGKMWGWDAPEVITYLEKRRNERTDPNKNVVPIPETREQANFLAKHLGVKQGHQLQNRPGLVAEPQYVPVHEQPRRHIKHLEVPPEQLELSNNILNIEKAPQLLMNFRTKMPIIVEGVSFPTAENAAAFFKYNYPGANSVSIDFAETIRKSPVESLLEKIGGGPPARPDWNRVKRDILFKINMAKFKQDTNAKNVLLSTGTTKLIDGDPDVSLTLMQVRQLLKID